MLLPSALGFSPHPPVSVYGTGIVYAIAAFLGTTSSYFATLIRSPSHLAFDGGFAYRLASVLSPVFALPGSDPVSVSPQF